MPSRTQLLILQHPRERLHPFGTARLARLALPQARIAVPYSGFANQLCCEVVVPDDAAVLFPHRDAVDVAALPRDQLPSMLVVLDGTWPHARRLYRDNAWLQRLRHVRLHPSAPSNYRIRKEPQADFVSTIEAIVQALRILEPDNSGLDALLALFDHMVDQQLEHVGCVPRQGRVRRPRQRASRRLSPVLSADNLIVVYTEAPLPDGDAAHEREVVQWTAVRVSSGEVFDAVIRPVGPLPSAARLEHMGLESAALRLGLLRDEAVARFAAFAGEGAALAAWTRTTLEWGIAFVGGRPSTVLKTDYCNWRNHRSSYLEDLVEREGLAAPALACRGRAAQRLRNALAVARWLRAELALQREQQEAEPGARGEARGERDCVERKVHELQSSGSRVTPIAE